MRKIKRLFLTLITLTILLSACKIKEEKPEKVKDLEFTVVSEECLPEELKTTIDEKKQNEFKMTYTDNKYLYICMGYGEQKTGGYSIAVNELYLTENAVYLDTNLMGPKPEDKKADTPSYPYIVIKVESIDKTVVFS